MVYIPHEIKGMARTVASVSHSRVRAFRWPDNRLVVLHGLGRFEKAAADFGACLFAADGVDKTALFIGVKLAQLIAIDLDIILIVRHGRLNASRQWQKHKQRRNYGQNSSGNPENHG